MTPQDPRIEKMADVLVNYALGVQPGWQVGILSTPTAAPLIGAAYRQILAAGGLPSVLLDLPGLEGMLLATGDDAQLDYVSPFTRLAWERLDAMLRIGADAGSGLDAAIRPERIARRQKALQGAGRVMDWRREGRPYSLTQFPSESYARVAGMNLSEYRDFVFRACMLDTPDPVGAWREVHTMQQHLVDWLDGKRTVHVASPNVDLTLSIAGRRFINSDGHHNFPSGEIFTGPVEDGVDGHIHFTYPAHYRGRDVEDVTLWFEQGRVARFEAGAGADFMASMLDLDAGARRLGEFAIGTNRGVDRFTRNVLYDEKMAGTMHCALGESYPDTGGLNHSAIHWDMVTDMRDGRITVDGQLFYDGGRFVV
jgi:aminopeptidase